MIPRRTFLSVVLSVFILTSCSTPSPTQSPLPTLQPVSSIAAPLAISPVMTPQPGMGIVMGQLIDIRTGQPAYKTILYLEPTIEHQAPLVLYGPLNGQPETDSLPDGRFVLDKVPPGEYILALYSPVDILYYQKPEGTAVIIQVKAGQVVDLGRVEYFIP